MLDVRFHVPVGSSGRFGAVDVDDVENSIGILLSSTVIVIDHLRHFVDSVPNFWFLKWEIIEHLNIKKIAIEDCTFEFGEIQSD